MFIRLLILAIILIPVFYFVYKFTLKMWDKAEVDEKEDKVFKKLDEIKQTENLYKQVEGVDEDAIQSKKSKIKRVIRS